MNAESKMNTESNIELRAFVIADYEAAFTLWSSIDGLYLSESDTKEAVAAFLDRNPGFSVVAVDENGDMVGAVLCGHNGRAASLYHLAVAESARGKGVGQRLVQFCVARLTAANVARCSVFVYTDNEVGNRFWLNNGWYDPDTWKVLQRRL